MSRHRRRSGGAELTGARQDVQTLVDRLGTTIDGELLVLALTHRSFAHEAGGIPTNERLEFLGDSVLGIIVTEHLFRAHPDVSEGELAKMRAATVSQRALAQVARELGLGEFILLGKGELTTGGREKDSILSDTVEALIGAAYLCHGLEHTRTVVENLVGTMLGQAALLGAGLDWKTSLQELAAQNGLGSPVYAVKGTGPDHARSFAAAVLMDGIEHGHGTGPSKKVAEQQAAADAYARLEEEFGGPTVAELAGTSPAADQAAVAEGAPASSPADRARAVGAAPSQAASGQPAAEPVRPQD